MDEHTRRDRLERFQRDLRESVERATRARTVEDMAETAERAQRGVLRVTMRRLDYPEPAIAAAEMTVVAVAGDEMVHVSFDVPQEVAHALSRGGTRQEPK